MRRKTIFYAALALTALLLTTGCYKGAAHPWKGKTYETISKEDGFRIRGGDPRTEGLDYIIYILKHDTADMPGKAAFMKKDSARVVDVLDIAFVRGEIFYVVENGVDEKTGLKSQYLVRKRYFPESDTSEPIELWRYNDKAGRVEHFEMSENFKFGL
ncbi:MAG: hypothetical protein LBD21_07240 [Tannerellaceae bacterium]|jgi:hypothetical protein|nr:hypothetical protein [Tannerellaceae bacterium]